MKIYSAGGCFNRGDYLRSVEFHNALQEAFPSADIYSPILNTEINGVEGKKKFADSVMIAEADNKRLDEADILVACIDGDIIGSGVSCEIGRFCTQMEYSTKPKHIIGICTDTRQCHLTHSKEKDEGGASGAGQSQYSYHNLYVTGMLNKYGVLVTTIDEVIDEIKKIGEISKYY